MIFTKKNFGPFEGKIRRFQAEDRYYWYSNDRSNCIFFDIFLRCHDKLKLQEESLGYSDPGSGVFPYCKSEADVIKFIDYCVNKAISIGTYAPAGGSIIKITPDEAKEIIDIACLGWKEKLANNWAKQIVLGQEIIVSPEFKSEMLGAATMDQYPILQRILNKIEPGTLIAVLPEGHVHYVLGRFLKRVDDHIEVQLLPGGTVIRCNSYNKVSDL